jgi:hypothetical protein
MTGSTLPSASWPSRSPSRQRPICAPRLPPSELAPPRRRWWPSAWPRAAVLAVIATLVLAATAAALVLVLPGLRITTLPTLPTPDVGDGPLATRLALGEPISADRVRAGIPDALGRPDEAYVIGDHEVISLVYSADAELPELAGSGIGMLVQVISGELEHERVEKLVAEVGVTVTAVEVDGAPGYWIEGQPHLIRYTDAVGSERAQRTRLVGDTLVWERDGVLYRIESGLGLEGTLRVAESIAP